MFNRMISGIGSFTKALTESVKGTLMGSLTRTLMGNLNRIFMGSLMGNLDQKVNRKINKNFDRKGGTWRREMKPGQWQWEKGWRIGRREWMYKKGLMKIV